MFGAKRRRERETVWCPKIWPRQREQFEAGIGKELCVRLIE